MPPLNRRDFLVKSTLAASATVGAFAGWPRRSKAAPSPFGIDMRLTVGPIDHVIVLMMENRSFDHMLGYLKLEEHRADVDGLTPGLANSDGNVSYPIHHLGTTAFKKKQDPCHSGACVAGQLVITTLDSSKIMWPLIPTIQSETLSWGITTKPIFLFMITSPLNSLCAITGSPPFLGRHGPIDYMR